MLLLLLLLLLFVVGAPVAINVVLRVGSHLRAPAFMRRRSPNPFRRRRSLVAVAVEARVVYAAAGASEDDVAVACGRSKGAGCSRCSGWGRVLECSQNARAGAQ